MRRIERDVRGCRTQFWASMTDLAHEVEEALGWSGFRRLTSAEPASGPFAPRPGERRHVRLDAGACNMAFVSSLEREADAACFVEHLALKAWGYDLNLEKAADHALAVNEFCFAITHEPIFITSELQRLGCQNQDRCWMHMDRECLVPSLGPGYTGEIFPCLGWVLTPDATSEFGPAERRSGFCTKAIPSGALAAPSSRGYHFVYAGYPQRSIARLRIVIIINPATPGLSAGAIVNDALTAAYGAM